MDCAGVAARLVSYHFGATSDADREAVDAHLLECTSCLRTYLTLKHAAEKAPLDKPGADLKSRLRARVAAKQVTSRTPFFTRRIPLYQGVALAAIAAALTLFVPRVLPRSNIPTSDGTPEIDTSRARAESLEIY